MTNNELMQYAIDNNMSLKESAKKHHRSRNMFRITAEFFDQRLIVKYLKMMQSRYQSIAREQKGSAQAKSRKKEVDLSFRCPCECGTVGKYCANQYYKETTGRELRELSFDSVFKAKFATYGALS